MNLLMLAVFLHHPFSLLDKADQRDNVLVMHRVLKVTGMMEKMMA